MRNVGRMAKVRAIAPELRCKTCAGFGFIYRTNAQQTEIRKASCGVCNGTGRALTVVDLKA